MWRTIWPSFQAQPTNGPHVQLPKRLEATIFTSRSVRKIPEPIGGRSFSPLFFLAPVRSQVFIGSSLEEIRMQGNIGVTPGTPTLSNHNHMIPGNWGSCARTGSKGVWGWLEEVWSSAQMLLLAEKSQTHTLTHTPRVHINTLTELHSAVLIFVGILTLRFMKHKIRHTMARTHARTHSG